MGEPIYPCNDKHEPKFLNTYKVADQQKKYTVCDSCSKLQYFQKYLLKKEPIDPAVKRSLDLD